MPKIIRESHKYFMLSFLVLFFIAGQPPEFGQESIFFHGFLVQKPIIRIALGVNLEDIRIRASSGMKIYQVGENYKLLASDAHEALIRGHKEKLTEKFVVRVAQTRREDDAEEIAKELRTRIDNRVYVEQDRENDLDGVYQVRVGDFLTRGNALDFIKKATLIGIKDAWIIREEVTEPTSEPQWILVNDELINLNEETSLYFIPTAPESYLSYGNKNYRGFFVLRGSQRGILLINILHIEDYLRGVVPGELSPYYFGELEAQKAQAIAARTYALKNIGQFKELGFDLFDTPVSQVYEGMSIEHPLSTQAVVETRGEVAVFNGKLINALYTSTCGGATEDIENIFEGMPLPYLKSTECVMEREQEWQVRGAGAFPPVRIDGADISPVLAYLTALDILPHESSLAYFKDTAGFQETAEWMRRACVLIGKRSEKFAPEQRALNFIGFARLVVDGFQWQERTQNLVGRSEAGYVTKDLSSLGGEEKSALAFFIISGIFPDSQELADRSRLLTRAEAAHYLAKVMATYRDFYHQGYFRELIKDRLVVVENDEIKQFELAPDVFLFRNMGEAVSLVPSLDLLGGDAIRWVENGSRVTLLQAVSWPITNILDRPSQYHRWQVRISREDLESRINQYYPIGKLIDLIPGKRGVSKRVIELAIIGQESQVRVTGTKIRQVLNLRDNLFVIDREQDEDNGATHFIFSGKGWGHGVGLCQVGAHRMAQKGAKCDEILKKYYRGIKVDKIY